MPQSVKVKLLHRANIATPTHKAHGWQESGTALETVPGTYAQTLVENGVAEIYREEGERSSHVIEGHPEDVPPPLFDVTDSARELAEKNNLDLSTVTGTGADGRIVKTDVAAALRHQE